MIKFYDSAGTVHFGQATITRKTSVNGGLSLTGEVFAGNDVLNGLDYGWRLNFDNEKYVITYKKLSDDTNTVVFDAVQQFFWDFAKVALHTQYNGSHKYKFYLNKLFDKSGYNYKNDAKVPAFEKENWGYKNKLDLFNDIIDQANVEFEVHNETVHIAKQLGSDLTSFVRKGINLSDLTEEMKISDFATYARGYGAFKDDQDKSKGRLEVEYRSELAKKFGDLEMDPIVDERYTVADNLIAELKKQVDATYTVSMTMNIYDLENAGYPNYEVPKVGDWILAIDEALNFKRKIRIIKLEENFDVTGKRIGYTATCGDLNIVDQYTHLQGSLDSKVQRIQKAVDDAATSANGKNTNYYGAKEPVSADEGDLWFDQSNSDPDKWSIKQWLNGRWEQITLNPGEVDAKVDVAKKEAETATENAKQLAGKYDDTNALANQAIDKAVGAQSDANSAIAKAESTASEFGKVSQKTNSAVAAALNAQSDANTALDNAKTAKDVADSAKVDVTQAKSDSVTALDNAKTALTNAKDAQTNANTALDNAKTAQDSADSIKVDVDDVKGTLDSKADKTSVDAVTKRVTTNETNITQNAKNIKSKASQSDVNNLTGRVSSAESEITQNANNIKSKVSSSDVQGMLDNGGYATQTWTGSQIKQSADEINSTVTSVSNKVDNLQVGGRNLIHDTSFEQGMWKKIWNHPTMSITSDGNLKFTIPDYNQAGVGVSAETLEMDKTYTLTVKVRGHGKFQPYIMYDGGIGNFGLYDSNSVPYPMIDSATEFVDIKYTFNVQGRDPAKQYAFAVLTMHAAGNWLEIKKDSLKLEAGNVSSSWSPAPEDMATVTALSKVDQKADSISSTVTSNKSDADTKFSNINQTIDGIQSTVVNKADSSDVTALTGRVSTNETNITQNAKDITSKVNQTDVDTLTGRVKDDESEITQNAKNITSKVSSSDVQGMLDDGGYATQSWTGSQIDQKADEISSTLETVQTQVQNSAVGTNLLTGTSNAQDFTMSGSGWTKGTQSSNGTNASIPCTPGKSYTYSAIVKSTTYDCYPEIQFFDSGKNLILNSTNFPGKDTGMRKSTAVAPANTAFMEVHMVLNNPSDSQTVVFNSEKLEKGSVATDWCPNPADNATVTAVSNLSQTVDGMQSDISKKIEQKDLNGYATETWAQNKINATADGINGTISSVKNTVNGHTTSINDLKADSSRFKSQFTTVNNTLGKQSNDIGTLKASSRSLSANFDSLNSDNQTNKHNISQLQASAEEFNNTLMTVKTQVQNSAVGTNLLTGTSNAQDFTMSGSGWTKGTQSSNGTNASIPCTPGKSYTYSAIVKSTTYDCYPEIQFFDSGKNLILNSTNFPGKDTGMRKSTAVAPANTAFMEVHMVLNNPSDSQTVVFNSEKLEKGSVATDWCPNPADNATVDAVSSISQTVDSIQTTVRGKVDNNVYKSKITQLKNLIDLRVEKDGVINAVNISPEGTSIYGNKLHITADTYIDNAVIKDAMIANLDASKITAGTLNAANVNIINMNANNITTGTLKGTNLSMNLNTGEVLFQKGSIKSTNGNLNIDIDSGKMGVVNSAGNGFRFENGKLYLTSNTWVNSFQSKPDYGYIAFKPTFLSDVKGMQIAGTDGIAVTTGDYDTSNIIFQNQPKSGTALSLYKNKAFLNARDNTRIEGGSMYTEISGFTKQARPAIVVGGANGGVNHDSPTDKYGNYHLQKPVGVGADIFAKGNKITLQGGHDTTPDSDHPRTNQLADLNLANNGQGFISSAAIFKRIYSNSPNVYITGYGILGRSTSASKYKLDISDVDNLTEKAQVFLAVKPKQWFDKQETQDFADTLTGNDRIQESPTVYPHAGFIAEDLATAGLNEFISYGADGSLEGIQYDRLPILHHELLRQAYNKIDYLMTQLNIMDKKISKLEGEN